ncbi:hypothetical protein J2Z22_000779 [Paenibacillus forsythiae]|uniref:Nitrile hydratase subunit beta n=1 Tax=Paenibacillus forsythiae TaxID=365616 RepID=A0ABU3H367_9BACL|nr:hypothetical protein [Paenibacillus forsythiae]MDT3425263.1 hypothetical protein [Paenibacillus forsythiae]
MDSFASSMDLAQFIGKLGDLKDEHYHMTLALTAAVELLIDKGLITRRELEDKMSELDSLMIRSPYPMA